MSDKTTSTERITALENDEWREALDDISYHVMQEAGTERPYTGVYWDATDDGTYRCKGCGADLFDSSTKYDAGCGWPSFTQPIEDGRVVEIEDRRRGVVRTEIRCARCNGHLGHVFPDGPGERGTRYCMNSAALAFDGESGPKSETAARQVEHGIGQAPPVPEGYADAIFSGGRFWHLVAPFQHVDGVIEVTSGFTGGHIENPSYRQVARGGSGHREAVRVIYDPQKVTYDALLDVYWRSIDPTDDAGQFTDRGEAFSPAIYVHHDRDRRVAEASKAALSKDNLFDAPIVVPIVASDVFWVAEEEHQDFYKKSRAYYARLRAESGRDADLQRVWKRA